MQNNTNIPDVEKTKQENKALIDLLEELASTDEAKPWWTSKTIWANTITIVASCSATYFGLVMDANMQIVILALVNIILRAVTKKPIVWA